MRCSATTHRGTACQNSTTYGFDVCDVHGGSKKDFEAIRERARENLEEAATTAVDTLVELMEDDYPASVRLAAARDVLDRVGLQATQRLEVTHIDDSDIDREIARLMEAMAPGGESQATVGPDLEDIPEDATG
jgi:hypothetical protein